MLCKEECPKQLKDNLSFAKTRLFNPKNQLVKDENLRKVFREIIELYLRKGYAQEITRKGMQNASTVCCLPHHPVVNSRKPGKLRVVSDCASKFKNFLNDKLMKGPGLATSFVGVLTRFMFLVVLLFWTDSTAVLHSIKNNTKRFSVLVADHLAVIEQNTELDCWHHMPSNLNPADLASRGIRANSSEMKKWLKEPEFLTKLRTKWPTNTLSRSLRQKSLFRLRSRLFAPP